MATYDQRSNLQREIKALTKRMAELKEERDQWIEEALDVGIDEETINRWCDF